jgi:hypothetical protein
MSRRIALPGADELFRSTGEPERATGPATEPPLARQEQGEEAAPEPVSALRVPAAHGAEEESGLAAAASAVRTVTRRRPRAVAERRPTGRERHEEKITVYVSADELMDLEHARLGLRGDFGLSADRGRIVREALAVVLADFEAKGDASILVRRLRGH